MSSPPYWRFAPTNGGAEQSNNAGQVTFAADPIAKAVRELLQNSVHHPQPGLDGVAVNFTLLDLPAAACNAPQLAQHARQAAQLLAAEGDPDGAARYQRAAALLSKPTVKTLAVTDAGTAGLVGDNWRNLIFREGKPTSDAGAAHGGSYGFGKNAAFNLSLANTILYSTRYVERAAQGRVAKMAGRAQFTSHPDPETGETLQAIGFFGRHRDGAYNQPLTGPELPDALLLPETGAGVFIIAFNTDYADWADQVAKTVATDFFAAVHDRKLSVAVRTAADSEPRIIKRDTLEIEFDRLPAKEPSRFYYRAYHDGVPDETVPTGQLRGMGRLLLRTLADAGAPRRLAHINRRGMLITDDRKLTDNPFYPAGGLSWSPWCAVSVAADDRTDAFIRRTEPPAHNAVQYRILNDPDDAAMAQAEYRHHREQVNKIIRDRIEQSLAESGHNIRELAELFPDLPDENSGAVPVPTATITPAPSLTPAEVQQDGSAEAAIPNEQPPRPQPDAPRPRPPNGGNDAVPNDEPVPNGKAAPAQAAIQAARAMQTAPDAVTVSIRLPGDIDGQGVAFAIRQAGEQFQPSEERVGIRRAAAYGTLAAQPASPTTPSPSTWNPEPMSPFN